MLAGFFIKFLSNVLYNPDPTNPDNNFDAVSSYGVHLTDHILNPSVVAYIGFNTMLTSIILLLVECQSRGGRCSSCRGTPTNSASSKQHQWTLRQKYNAISMIGLMMLLLNILLRVLLDRVTYEVGYQCRTIYNVSQVHSGPSRWERSFFFLHIFCSPTILF